MTRHPLDGNAIAADAHYGRDDPPMVECPDCGGSGREPGDEIFECGTCHGEGEVPATPDDDYGDHLYEQARDRAMERGE